MPAPELRMGKRGGWTAASLRDHYRHKISNVDGMDRQRVAYAALSQMALDGGWTRMQMKAVATGLELGMKEGTR